MQHNSYFRNFHPLIITRLCLYQCSHQAAALLDSRKKCEKDAPVWAQRQAPYQTDFRVVSMVNLTPQHFSCSNE